MDTSAVDDHHGKIFFSDLLHHIAASDETSGDSSWSPLRDEYVTTRREAYCGGGGSSTDSSMTGGSMTGGNLTGGSTTGGSMTGGNVTSNGVKACNGVTSNGDDTTLIADARSSAEDTRKQKETVAAVAKYLQVTL